MEELRSFRIQFTVTRETVKPSSPSPTPDDQGSFKLSFLDQLYPSNAYIPTLVFYKGITSTLLGGGGRDTVDARSERLKSSLSETLTRFYPFAGRLKDHLSICCNNEGVEYSAARVLSHSLFDVLQKPNQRELTLLLPDEPRHVDMTTRPLLLVQVSFFNCGGMALGIKYCHKIADGATFTSFLNGWADSALGKPDLVTPDLTTASTLFPPTDSLSQTPRWEAKAEDMPNLRASRFVFGPSELAALQAKATRVGGGVIPPPKPTRVEAVSAFLWKTTFSAKREVDSGCPNSSAFMSAVNLRSRLQPPLPAHCLGNMIWAAATEGGIDTEDLPVVADQLRLGVKDLCNNFIQMLKGGDVVNQVAEMNTSVNNLRAKGNAGTSEVYALTSRCKLPLYESDFGWGKPVWITAGGLSLIPNLFTLADTKDGQGIEAWVTVTEQVAARMECNEELQKYAAFNPNAFN